jgi:hypothetical protein
VCWLIAGGDRLGDIADDGVGAVAAGVQVGVEMRTDRPAQPSAGGRPAQAPINAEPPGLPVSLGNRITLPGDFRFAAGSNQLAA